MEQLKVEHKNRGEVGIIELIGDVTALAEESVMAASKNIDAAGARKVLLKFNKASYINSAGIAILISLVSDARKKNQRVAVCGLSGHFKKVFDMIGLTDYLSIHDTEEEALKGF
jgi:anti-anti-sigma factor